MPEPLKDQFNKKMVADMAANFAKAWPQFDSAGFIAAATKDFRDLELKQRSTQITEVMRLFMPENYERAADILLVSLMPEELCETEPNRRDG
jgi:hypothetical protein